MIPDEPRQQMSKDLQTALIHAACVKMRKADSIPAPRRPEKSPHKASQAAVRAEIDQLGDGYIVVIVKDGKTIVCETRRLDWAEEIKKIAENSG